MRARTDPGLMNGSPLGTEWELLPLDRLATPNTLPEEILSPDSKSAHLLSFSRLPEELTFHLQNLGERNGCPSRAPSRQVRKRVDSIRQRTSPSRDGHLPIRRTLHVRPWNHLPNQGTSRLPGALVFALALLIHFSSLESNRRRFNTCVLRTTRLLG